MQNRMVIASQIGLAFVAFGITAWVFFKERPRVEENQELQHQLTEVKQQNQELRQAAKPDAEARKQSRQELRRGVNLLHQQHYDEALAAYDKALLIYPDDAYGWSLKGYALFRAGRIPESIQANQRAVELDSGDPLNYLDLAKSYCAAKQYDDAERVLLKDPPPEVSPDIKENFVKDGEFRRVCKPILARISQPPK